MTIMDGACDWMVYLVYLILDIVIGGVLDSIGLDIGIGDALDSVVFDVVVLDVGVLDVVLNVEEDGC